MGRGYQNLKNWRHLWTVPKSFISFLQLLQCWSKRCDNLLCRHWIGLCCRCYHSTRLHSRNRPGLTELYFYLFLPFRDDQLEQWFSTGESRLIFWSSALTFSVAKTYFFSLFEFAKFLFFNFVDCQLPSVENHCRTENRMQARIYQKPMSNRIIGFR